MFIKPPFRLLLTILLCLTLFSACRPQPSTPTSREADSVEPSVSQEETVSEPQKSSVSQEDTSTAPAPAEFLPGAFVLQNGNEIQNGPRDKGLNPLLATLIFYEDGSFQFDFDGGLSAGGFSGQYEVEEGRITAESTTSAYENEVRLIFRVEDENTLTFVEDQGGNHIYYVNKAKLLELLTEGDPFVRTDEIEP